jgi:hypothetical protein
LDAAAGQAFARLVEFLAGGRLTGVVASLEQELSGRGASEAADAARAAGFEPALLEAALLIRRDLGRLNDLVHATAISLALPLILEPGERLTVTESNLGFRAPAQRNRAVWRERFRGPAGWLLVIWMFCERTRRAGRRPDGPRQ